MAVSPLWESTWEKSLSHGVIVELYFRLAIYDFWTKKSAISKYFTQNIYCLLSSFRSFVDEKMQKCFFSSFLNTADEIHFVDIFASPNFQTICCSQIVITYPFFKTSKITQKFHKVISSINTPIWQHCKVINFRKKAP